MGWSDDLNACAALVEKGDPDRFRTVMAAPLKAREKLFPLYAFNVEVSRAPWVTAEPMIAEMRLQWWRDALEEIASGGAVRRHEVVTPLAEALGTDAARALDDLVVARRWDCYKDPFEDGAHLSRYFDDTGGTLARIASILLGATAEVSHAAHAAGRARGIAHWLRAIPELEAARRVPLLDVTPNGVRALALDGLAALQTARTLRVPAAVLPAFWPATGCARTLNAAVRAPTRVASGSLPQELGIALTWASLTGVW